MTPGDAARVLAACALFDNRKVPDDEDGERLVMGWHAIIGHLDLHDALEAVRRHYSDSAEWIMPVHIRKGVAAIKAERRRNQPHEARQLPSGFEEDEGRRRRKTGGAATVRKVLGPVLERLAQKSEHQPPAAIDQLRQITAGPGWAEDEDTREEGK